MTKLNCWEFKNCGRDNGSGKCIAYSMTQANGVNSGANGGRVCWAVAGTQCGGQQQGTFAQKIGSCLKCDFYAKVKEEEGLLKFKMSF